MIKHYKSCLFYPSKSKLESSKLGCVWKFITGENLNGAHNSLVDERGQMDVVIHKYIIHFMDKSSYIYCISDILTMAKQAAMMKRMEPDHPVHKTWIEIDHETTKNGLHEWMTQMTGLNPVVNVIHPIVFMMWISLQYSSICSPSNCLSILSRWWKYTYEDWVVHIHRAWLDRDDNTTFW